MGSSYGIKKENIPKTRIMKTIFKYLDFKTLLIVALVIVILILRSCGSNVDKKDDIIKVDGKKYIVVKREIDTVYQPTVQTVYREGKTIFKDVPVYVNVPANVDTLNILKDYYTKVTYKDTLHLKDSLGYISVIDTIFNNKILNRVWDSHVNKITINDKIYLKDLPKTQLYIGGVLGFDKVNIVNFAGPSFILKTKKDHMYSLGVGYSNNQVVSIQGGVYWKIKLKK
jgi:hypothetical protein